MELRWYQQEAVDAAWSHLCGQAGNPVIVAPTGSGKSLVIAQLCRDAVERFGVRVIVLAHRKELLAQNADKLRRLAPSLDIGIYSAGLKSRDTEAAVVLAGIQSAYNRPLDFGQRSLVIVDEAHLCPHDGEGMYREFFAGLRGANPQLRTVGLTATPFRLDCGPLCRPQALFQKVCYSASVHRMIAEGFLCNLVTSAAKESVDMAGVKLRAGEFASQETESRFNRDAAVDAACAEIVGQTGGRHSVLVFCAGVQHAQHVGRVLESLTGERVGVVTGETIPLERDATLTAFRGRRLRWLCNVDVLTTGFDAPCIDAIAVLRATMSAGLFCQMVGRGFRIDSSKENCLVLDFGGNLQRHGPVDSPDYGRCKRTGEGGVVGEAPTKVCPNCEEVVLASATECACGWAFPREAGHGAEADGSSPILSTPEKWIVQEMAFARHEKKGGLPSMVVTYTCGPADSDGGNLEAKVVREWVCFDHDGYARQKAVRWWRQRSITPVPQSVDEAVDLARRGATAWPFTIVTQRDGRWDRIIDAQLDAKPAEWMAADKWVEVADAFEEIPF